MRGLGGQILGTAAALLLIAASFAGFFTLTPWLACRPLSELAQTMRDPVIQQENPGLREGMPLPSGMRCFTVEHNRVYFFVHGLIAEEPGRFALHVAAMIVPCVLLLLLLRSGPRAPGTLDGDKR